MVLRVEKMSNGLWNVSDGFGKVPGGLKGVSDSFRKVSDDLI